MHKSLIRKLRQDVSKRGLISVSKDIHIHFSTISRLINNKRQFGRGDTWEKIDKFYNVGK